MVLLASTWDVGSQGFCLSSQFGTNNMAHSFTPGNDFKKNIFLHVDLHSEVHHKGILLLVIEYFP